MTGSIKLCGNMIKSISLQFFVTVFLALNIDCNKQDTRTPDTEIIGHWVLQTPRVRGMEDLLPPETAKDKPSITTTHFYFRPDNTLLKMTNSAETSDKANFILKDQDAVQRSATLAFQGNNRAEETAMVFSPDFKSMNFLRLA